MYQPERAGGAFMPGSGNQPQLSRNLAAHTQNIQRQPAHNSGIKHGNMPVQESPKRIKREKVEMATHRTAPQEPLRSVKTGESEMARLGEFEYPDIGLLESIDLGKKISREFAGEVSRHGLARSLGMAERGGAFAARIGALRMWGIVTGRSRLRVTRDGLRAVNPLSPQEADSARRTLAGHVTLFSEMASRMGAGPYDHARLAVLVEEITGADRPAVAGRIVALDRVFSEVRPHLLKRAAYSSSSSSVQRPAPALDDVNESPAGSYIQEPAYASERVMAAGLAGSAMADRLPEREPAASGGGRPAPRAEAGQGVSDVPRIEIILPDGRLSLPESVSNVDAALTVLWARRQLLAAVDASKGKPSPPPPVDLPRS